VNQFRQKSICGVAGDDVDFLIREAHHLARSQLAPGAGFGFAVYYHGALGHQTQRPIHKILADKIRSLIAEYHELERYGRFGSELTPETQKLLKLGSIAMEFLKQEHLIRIDPTIQILLLSLLFTPFFDNKDLEFVRNNKTKILSFLRESPEFKIIGNKILTISLDNLIENMNQNISALEKTCQTK